MALDKGKPLAVAAGATVDFDSSCLIGFLCTTGGTITISKRTSAGVTTLVNALTVTAGQWVDIPIILDAGQGRVVSAAAVGVLVIR